MINLKSFLWIYFNSSIFWLLREISGRKNLGGGLLKSEATDLKVFPTYFKFDLQKSQVNTIERDIFDTLTEIKSSEHQKFDQIVFDYLGLSTGDRVKCVEFLKKAIMFRTSKAIT